MMQILFNLIRKKTTRRAAVLILVTSFAAPEMAIAQDQSGTGKIYGGLGYFATGYQQPNLSALNNMLTKEGFSAASSGYITFGGGGHSIIGNVVIGGEGHSFSGKTSQTARAGTAVETAFDGGYGCFNVGYVVLAKKGMLLYPMLGLGGGGMTLELSDAPQAGSFQSMLQDHKQGVKLENGGFLLNFQLAADYLMHGNEKGRGGLLLGIHAGYIYAPGKWDNWTWQNARLANGPDASLSGPYVRLTIGGGGYGRGKNNN